MKVKCWHPSATADVVLGEWPLSAARRPDATQRNHRCITVGSASLDEDGMPPQVATFFRRTFDEALTLAIEARNYAAYVERHERDSVDAFVGLRMSNEALRVTSRLTQVLAWLLNQRAVHEGDISPHEVLAEPNRLSVADICLDQGFADDETLPKGLRSLMARSHHLYVRVARLEQQILSRLS